MLIFNNCQLTKKLYIPVLIAGMSFFLVATATAATITAGIDDNFSGGVDPAVPSVELSALLGVTVGFDGVPHNEHVAHTFSELPTITTAILELRIEGGVNPGVDTDGIFISFVDSTTVTLLDGIAWARTFGDYAGGGTVHADPDPGIVSPGTIWDPNSSAFLTLDLSALPLNGGGTLDIIPLINSNGFFDISVSDDSAADFYRLTYNNTTAVPIPAAFWLFGSGLMGLIGIARRKKVA